MLQPFKFFRQPILRTHNGTYIYAEQYFYTMNREDQEYTSITGEIKITPKYTIVQRFIPKMYEKQFKPDYFKLWYFNTKREAEFYKQRMEHWDEYVNVRR